MTGRWDTVVRSRRVLAVARTVTSLNRVLDVLAIFADDVRIQVVFVVNPGSRFGGDVPAVLERLGARTVEWREAIATEYDLVISASDHDDLHQLRGPLVLLPHGAGFQKYSPYGGGERAGLTSTALWHEGRPVPDTLVVSHENQRALVPDDLTDRVFVGGDPSLDALTALVGRRGELRRQLGIGQNQILVTLTSTWGPRSLLGRWPTLPAQLLAELPWDEFRVAAVLHPNVWASHSAWQIRHWMRTALACGLILLPPTGPWQLGLAAADCVVGDHGSLSAYATGLGVPLLLGAFGAEEVPPGSPMGRLGEIVRRLDGQQSLAEQVRQELSASDRDVLRGLADQVFAQTGSSLVLLQRRLYELLDLQPEHQPRPRTIDSWRVEPRDVNAFHVELNQDRDTLAIERFPAALREFARPRGARHLIAFDDAEETLLQNAAAIITQDAVPNTEPQPDAARRDDALDLLDRFPGCRVVVAVPQTGAMVLTSRDGRSRSARYLTATDLGPVPVAAAWLHRVVPAPETTEVAIRVAGSAAQIRFAAEG